VTDSMSGSMAVNPYGFLPGKTKATAEEALPREYAGIVPVQDNTQQYSPVGATINPNRFLYQSFADYINSNTRDYSGTMTLSNYISVLQEKISSGKPFTEIVVNVSLRDINSKFGHAGGDAYLTKVFRTISETGISYETSTRDAASFTLIIDGTDKAAIKGAMSRISEALSRVDKLEIFKGRFAFFEGGIKPNITAAVIDPSRGGITLTDLMNVHDHFIGKANAGEGAFEVADIDAASAKRLDLSGKVKSGITPFDASTAWPKWWDVLKNKVRSDLSHLDLSDAKIEEAVRRIYVDPQSGLFNKKAYNLISSEMARMQKPGDRILKAHVDGNKLSAFKKEYGAFGDHIVEMLVKKLGPDAAGTLAPNGTILFRDPKGDEMLMEKFVEASGDGKNLSDESVRRTSMQEFEHFAQRTKSGLIEEFTARELRAVPDSHGYLREYIKGMGIELDTLPEDARVSLDLPKLKRSLNGKVYSEVSFTGNWRAVEAKVPVKFHPAVDDHIDRATDALKSENPERTHMFREGEKINEATLRDIVKKFKEGSDIRVEVDGKTLAGKIGKVITGKTGAFAFIAVVGLAEPVILNLSALSESEQSGRTTVKNISIGAGATAVSIGLFELGTRTVLYSLTRAGAGEIAAFLGTKAIPVVGWALTAVAVFDVGHKLYLSNSMGKVNMMDVVGLETKNPDGSVRKPDNKGFKFFNLDDRTGNDPIQVGEVETAVTLFKMGYFNDRSFGRTKSVTQTQNAVPMGINLGSAAVDLNFTPTGRSVVDAASIDRTVMSAADPDAAIYESVRELSSGKMESLDFASVMLSPLNRMIFRAQLKEALMRFRSYQGYGPSDGVKGHITNYDITAILSAAQLGSSI